MSFKQQLRWPKASLRLSLTREQRDRFRKLNLKIRQLIGAYIRFPGDRPGYLISQCTSYRTDLLAVVVGENASLRSLSGIDQPLSAADFPY